jgi:hypothetical protein
MSKRKGGGVLGVQESCVVVSPLRMDRSFPRVFDAFRTFENLLMSIFILVDEWWLNRAAEVLSDTELVDDFARGCIPAICMVSRIMETIDFS